MDVTVATTGKELQLEIEPAKFLDVYVSKISTLNVEKLSVAALLVEFGTLYLIG